MGHPTNIFSPEPSTSCICIICHEVLELASSLKECGHTFCNECIATSLEIVPLRGENKKIGQVLSAFGLGDVNDDTKIRGKFRAKMIMWGFEYDTDHTGWAQRTYERWSHSAFVKEDRLRCRVMICTPDIKNDVIVNKCKREDCNKIRAKTRISGKGDNTVMQDFTYCSIHIEECENKLVYGLDKADVIKAKKRLDDWKSKSSDTISKKNEERESRNQVSTLLSLTIMNMN